MCRHTRGVGLSFSWSAHWRLINKERRMWHPHIWTQADLKFAYQFNKYVKKKNLKNAYFEVTWIVILERNVAKFRFFQI